MSRKTKRVQNPAARAAQRKYRRIGLHPLTYAIRRELRGDLRAMVIAE